MIVQRKLNDKLNSLVDLLWYVDEKELHKSDRDDIAMPTGHMHVVYNLADPYFLFKNNKSMEISNTVLVGQIKHAVQITYGEHVKQLGIALRPAAFYLLFNQVSGLYTDTIINCEMFPNMMTLHSYIDDALIKNKDNIEGLFDDIEEYFKPFLADSGNLEIYENMITYMDDVKGLIDIKTMAEKFGYSVSALERNFKKNLGLTPKAYADIIRFKHALEADDPTTLFYDQSHFIKTCRKYTSKVPKALSESVEITLKHSLNY